MRRFEPGDASAVAGVVAHAMRQSVARDYPPERLEPLIAWYSPERLCALALERRCLVATDGGVIVGTASLNGTEVVTFFVHPDFQGSGVGTRLIGELERAAVASGVTELQVEASLTGTSFYERHGFERTGALVDTVAGPHVGLLKRLGVSAAHRVPAAEA